MRCSPVAGKPASVVVMWESAPRAWAYVTRWAHREPGSGGRVRGWWHGGLSLALDGKVIVLDRWILVGLHERGLSVIGRSSIIRGRGVVGVLLLV